MNNTNQRPSKSLRTALVVSGVSFTIGLVIASVVIATVIIVTHNESTGVSLSFNHIGGSSFRTARVQKKNQEDMRGLAKNRAKTKISSFQRQWVAPKASDYTFETPTTFSMKIIAIHLLENIEPTTNNPTGKCSLIYLNPQCQVNRDYDI